MKSEHFYQGKFYFLFTILYCCFHTPLICSGDSLKVTRYYNELTGFSGVYDSDLSGLVFSNSTGTYFLDKISGENKRILDKSGIDVISAYVFFEYDGILYLNDKWNYLYKVVDGVAELVTKSYKSHLVYNNKLYLLLDEEPRIQVHTKDGIHKYHLGEKNESFTASWKVYDGIVYGFLGLNWSGNTYFFKMTGDIPEYILDPSHQYFAQFDEFDVVDDFVPVGDEYWFTSYQGLFRLTKSGISQEFNEKMTFSKSIHNSIDLVGDKFIGYTHDNLYIYDLIKNEELVLHKFINTSWRFRDIDDFTLYLIDNNIYKLNKKNLEFSLFRQGEDVVSHYYLSQNGLFVAYPISLVWYDGNNSKTFGGDGLYTNTFFSLAYDRKNDKLVALGKTGYNYMYQIFDGSKWSKFIIPDSVVNTSYTDISNVEIDYDGRYFFSFRSVLAVYDGISWKKHSFLIDPKSENPNQRENYHIILTDSTGCIWINANLAQVQADGKWAQQNSLWKYFDNKFNHMTTSHFDRTGGRLKNGICLPNGDIYFDVSEEYLLKYKHNEFTPVRASDGKDTPFTNDARRLGFNSIGELVTTYDHVQGWRRGYGSYILESGVSVLKSDDVWDHSVYKEIALKYFKTCDWMSTVTDKYGKTWLYRNDKWLRFNGNNSFKLFMPTIPAPTFRPINNEVVQYKGDLWFVSDAKGLFKVEVPDPATSVEFDEEKFEKVILSIEDNSGILRLSKKFDKYTICGIDANPIISDNAKDIINIANLSSGTYLIIVNDGSNYIFEKFIILR